MRKIILLMNTTLDGFTSGLNGEMDWHFPYWDDEMSASWNRLLLDADTFLLGRKTYVAFADYWKIKTHDPTIARQDIILAEMMNRYRKVVVSEKLRVLPWTNSIRIKGNIPEQLRKLKREPGRHIVIFGSCRLVSLLVQYRLIDECVLWVHPVKINHGARSWALTEQGSSMKLTHTEQFNSGVIKCCYACKSST